MDEKKIAHYMEVNHCGREEAIELIAYDEEIDKMSMSEVDSDLTPEQKAAVKKAKGGIRSVDAYGKKRVRERKENPTKRGIIAELADFLTKNSDFSIENCEITNVERQIAFKCGENRYELTLVQKRPPKK